MAFSITETSSSAGGGTASSTTLDDTNLIVSKKTNIQSFAESVDQELLRHADTGVYTSYVSSVTVGGTTFSHGAVGGEIKSGGLYYDVQYAGAAGITVDNLAVNTFVYIDNAGSLQQQTSVPTKSDWMQKIFTMVVVVEGGVVVNFEYLNSPIGHYSGTTRDLWLYLIEQGIPLKIGQVVTGRADNLGFDVGAGSLMQFGSTGDIENPHVRPYATVSNADYVLFTRTTSSINNTDLIKSWDNADVITALGSTTCVAHRLYRFGSGTLALQYGQGNYANMDLCRTGARLEDFVRFPGLEKATFLGWWLLDERATTTSNSVYAEFVEYTIGIQGGTSSSLSGCLLKGNNLSDLQDLNAALVTLGLNNVTNLSDANQVETGALDSGSITSGFGDVDVGSSSISGGTFAGTGAGNSSFVGDVGIGTTTPLVKLDVAGATAADPATSGTTQTGASLRLSPTGSGGTLDFGNLGGGTSWIQATDITDLSQTYKLSLQPNGGNVGIGTTTPGAKLEVNGPVKYGIYTVSTVPSAAATPDAYITVSDDANGSVLVKSNGTIWLRVSDNTQTAV
jgi:hypothetical protein